MAFPGLVRANNLSDIVDREKAWDNLGANISAEEGLSAAVRYISLVELADGQPLEDGVRQAIYDFVSGCQSDGIWGAIKASCILAGARTLAGALVPLVGTAPTSFNFVSGDYNRKTGLVGNKSNKYLNSNRNNNSDPQDSNHNAIYATSIGTPTAVLMGTGTITTESGGNNFGIDAIGPFFRNRSGTVARAGTNSATGLIGTSRDNSNSFTIRVAQSSTTANITSQAPFSGDINIYSVINGVLPSDCRLAFYSIGESLDLALLEARVTTLVSAIAAAIP